MLNDRGTRLLFSDHVSSTTMETVAPEHLIAEAHDRMIGLIIRDSYLIRKEIIEINIFTVNKFEPGHPNMILTFCFRRTINSYTLAGIHKLN